MGKNGLIQYERCHLCKFFIDKGNYYLQLGCGHRLHKKCIQVWFLRSSACPVCDHESETGNLFAQKERHSELATS